MEYADGEGRDWRTELQRWCESVLGWSVFNPNLESDRFFARHHPSVDFRTLKIRDLDRYREIVAQLVDIDCREIATRTDLVVCLWDASAMRGAGTKGELTIARFTGKPVYLVTTLPLAEIPGWVLGCTTAIFPSFAALQEHLRSLPPA
jgi:hypothetical protein